MFVCFPAELFIIQLNARKKADVDLMAGRAAAAVG
jgi:hypothetical protein